MDNLTKYALEHIIRASGRIADDDKVLIIGSNAILAHFENAPPPFMCSREIDVAFFDDKDSLKSDKVDGAIGELSSFQEEYQYYAHGVSIETAVLPDGWEKRLKIVKSQNTDGIEGNCISIEDLAASKLVAGREKDIHFVCNLLRYRLTAKHMIQKVLEALPDFGKLSSGLVYNPKQQAKDNFEICIGIIGKEKKTHSKLKHRSSDISR